MTHTGQAKYFDSEWTLKQSIINAVAEKPNPSIIRLNRNYVEEFGYLPDDSAINYFIDCIKQKKISAQKNNKNPEYQFSQKIAHDRKPSVTKFNKLFRKKFGRQPETYLLKEFLISVKATKENTRRKEQPAFILAEKIAYSDEPTYSNLKVQYELKFQKPASFALIDFFIAKIIRRQQDSMNTL